MISAVMEKFSERLNTASVLIQLTASMFGTTYSSFKYSICSYSTKAFIMPLRDLFSLNTASVLIQHYTIETI